MHRAGVVLADLLPVDHLPERLQVRGTLGAVPAGNSSVRQSGMRRKAAVSGRAGRQVADCDSKETIH